MTTNESATKTALITGATSGIGKATALKLASLGYQVILCGRRRNLLMDIEKNVRAATMMKALALCFDVRNREEVERHIDQLPSDWRDIDVLVNNAGLAAGLDTFDKGSHDDWEQMIDTNLKGLLYVSRKVVPGMVNRKSGHIINITSIAGKEVYPKGNVYCATKHAVDALTQGMRIDLLEHGIKVTSIAPGMVDTEFSLVRFKGNMSKAAQVYEGLEPLHADDVADAIAFVVSRPAHVNINDMLIMPTAQASGVLVKRDPLSSNS